MPSADSYRKRAAYWEDIAKELRERVAAYGRMLTDSNIAYKAAALIVKAQDKEIEWYKAQVQRLVEESRKSKSRNVASLEAEAEELRALLQDMFQKRNGWRDAAHATKETASEMERMFLDLNGQYEKELEKLRGKSGFLEAYSILLTFGVLYSIGSALIW